MDNQLSPEQNGEASPTTAPPIQESQPANAIPAEQATAEQLTEVEKEMTGFEKATLRWAKIAIFLSALAAVFVCAQWYEMHLGGQDTRALAQAADTQAKKMTDMSAAADKIRQAAEDMVTQDRRIADNAQKAMDASNRQNQAVLEATIRNAQLDERAWIVVKEAGANVTLNQRPSAEVRFLNTGKTPAKNLRYSCNFWLETEENKVPFNKQLPYTKSVLIAPNDSNDLCVATGAQRAVKQTDLDRFTSGVLTFFVYGSATYDDIFGRSHWVTFCRILRRDLTHLDVCETRPDDTGDGDKPPN